MHLDSISDLGGYVPRLTRRQQQERSRRALLESAVQVFADFGFHGATVEAITENASFSRGAFYSNFKSKEELFLELFRMRTDERIAELKQVLDGPDDLLARARAAGRQWSRIVAHEPSWVLLLLEFWTYAARTPSIREEFARIDRAFVSAVAEMISDQAKKAEAELPLSPDVLSTAMIGLAAGIALQQLADPGRVPDDLYEQAFALMVRGMAPAPAAVPAGTDS